MSICVSGIKSNTSGGTFHINVENSHPLVLLANSLPWESMYNLIDSDIKQSTKNKCWWLGRKLKIRTHLGVYILQQMNNLTDRKMESAVKENVVYQIFCGRQIVTNWKTPDHTKIESFRSRLSPETQQKLANLFAQHAVNINIADPSKLDIDSTVQEANITYPTDAKMLRKLGGIAALVSDNIKGLLPKNYNLTVDLKNIASKARDYFFRTKNTTSKEKYKLLSNLLNTVSPAVKETIKACNKLKSSIKKELKWNVLRALNQLTSYGEDYLDSVKNFIKTGRAKSIKNMNLAALFK